MAVWHTSHQNFKAGIFSTDCLWQDWSAVIAEKEDFISLLYTAKSDGQMCFGCTPENNWYAIELAPSIFDKVFRRKGTYLYKLDGGKFEDDARLPMKASQCVSKWDAKILSCRFIEDIWLELQKYPITFITYDKLIAISRKYVEDQVKSSKQI